MGNYSEGNFASRRSNDKSETTTRLLERNEGVFFLRLTWPLLHILLSGSRPTYDEYMRSRGLEKIQKETSHVEEIMTNLRNLVDTLTFSVNIDVNGQRAGRLSISSLVPAKCRH